MQNESDSQWLQLIGKALAYLCLQEIAKNEPKRVPDIPAKVRFLESLGMPTNDAAEILGTTANSVKTNLRARAKRKGTASVKTRKK